MTTSCLPQADLVLVFECRFFNVFGHKLKAHTLDMAPPAVGIQEGEVAKDFFPPWATDDDKFEIEAS
jgi:hypothetical protein